jgi:hypothetical protein
MGTINQGGRNGVLSIRSEDLVSKCNKFLGD